MSTKPLIDDPKTLINCQVCGCSVRKSRLEKHIKKAHPKSDTTLPKISNEKTETFVKCQVCGSRVRRDRLEKHFKKAHPKSIITLPKISIDDPKSFVICQVCGCLVRRDRLEKHISKTHPKSAIKSPTTPISKSIGQKHRITKEDYAECEFCGGSYLKDYLPAHVRRMHPLRRKREKITTSEVEKAPVKRPLRQGQENYRFENAGGIILISRRGMRVGPGRCAECGIHDRLLWRYAESNRGTVCLCSNCKGKVFDRSFGHPRLDALDLAYKT
jgi:RNA polymerase-binding transcription factor DksA